MNAKTTQWTAARPRFHLLAAVAAAIITASLMLGIDELATHYSTNAQFAAASGTIAKV
jgi:hypothetical protein